MFVVRIVVEGETVKLNAFERKPDAESHFFGWWFQVEDYEDASAVLYEVPFTPSHKESVEAVKEGRSNVQLLESRPEPLPDLDLDI